MTDDRKENKHCDKAGMRPGSAVDRKDGLVWQLDSVNNAAYITELEVCGCGVVEVEAMALRPPRPVPPCVL